MRETRIAQASLFDNYSKHEYGIRLEALSRILDDHPEILKLIETDLVCASAAKSGRNGLSVESVFRCLLLKQQLSVSYEQLAFHLSDSTTYRAFARLPINVSPGKSCLQSTIRSIKPETIEKVHSTLTSKWVAGGVIDIKKIRIDSTVIKSDITPPSDSQLLNDSVRVLSRYLVKSHSQTGIKIRFTDKRNESKSMAFSIFNAKKPVKELIYPKLLILARVVLKQVDRALTIVNNGIPTPKTQKWIDSVEHFKTLMLRVVDQTQRRVIDGENVPASEKVVSIFEDHTDIIIKGFRDVQYGHKVNLSTEKNGFITHFSVEDGNPADKDLYLPVLDAHKDNYNSLPSSVVCDGGYASKNNVIDARSQGIKHAVFHKRVGISYQDMGVKIKTFIKLRNFRAGVEGNISELKRAFGAGKAKWKGHDGFKAFAWSSVLCYNLVRMARQQSG
jgi:IS5 family transposase